MLLTFLTGVAAGSFVYLNGFREIDIDPVVPSVSDPFEIRVTEYGGLTQNHRFYRIQDTGFYVFVGADKIAVNGYLAEDQISSLQSVLVDADLKEQAKIVSPDFCESWVDGIDTRYEISFAQEEYTIDTCGTNIDVDSDLIELLDWLWVQFKDGSEL